jgi:hypothetical protein
MASAPHRLSNFLLFNETFLIDYDAVFGGLVERDMIPGHVASVSLVHSRPVVMQLDTNSILAVEYHVPRLDPRYGILPVMMSSGGTTFHPVGDLELLPSSSTPTRELYMFRMEKYFMQRRWRSVRCIRNAILS